MFTSITHLLTPSLGLFFLSFRADAVPCWYLVEAATQQELWSIAWTYIRLCQSQKACGMPQAPKWIPHVVYIISSLYSWPTVKLETKFTVIRSASSSGLKRLLKPSAPRLERYRSQKNFFYKTSSKCGLKKKMQFYFLVVASFPFYFLLLTNHICK